MNRKFAYILLLLLFLILGGAGCFLVVSDSILLTGWMWTVPASYAPKDAILSAPVHNTAETKEREETVLPTLPELPSANSEESAETMENTASEEGAEVVPLCVKMEEELSGLDDEDKKEMLLILLSTNPNGFLSVRMLL